MKRSRRVYLVWLILYIGILCGILFGRRGYHTNSTILYWDYVKRNIQLIPMKTVVEMMNKSVDPTASFTVRILSGINVFGNIAMMVPLGYLVPSSMKCMQRPKMLLFASLGFTISMESIQLIALKGSFDIDDILLNLVGIAAGFWVYRKRTC